MEKRATTEEPAKTQGPEIMGMQLQGTVFAEFVVKVVTIAGLALK